MIQPDAIPGCTGRLQRKRGSTGQRGDRGMKEEEGEIGRERGGWCRLPLCSL